MAVTKSWESSVASRLDFAGKAKSPERKREFFPLLGASVLVACGLALVFSAKTQDFPALQQRLDAGELVDINSAKGASEISSILLVFSDPAERAYAASRIFSFLELHRPLPTPALFPA